MFGELWDAICEWWEGSDDDFGDGPDPDDPNDERNYIDYRGHPDQPRGGWDCPDDDEDDY